MIDLPTTGPLEPADDRKVEAALIEHGGVLTRDDLAATPHPQRPGRAHRVSGVHPPWGSHRHQSQDWMLRLPADGRRGIELLARQGVIEPSGRQRWVETWEPTADVLYSLCLRRRGRRLLGGPRRLTRSIRCGGPATSLGAPDSLVAPPLTSSCAIY